MAALPVTFIGIDGNGNPVTMTGMLAYSDRAPGGGPIIPPVKPPIDPGAHPEHPIAPGGNVPAHPIELPHPEHPIALPPTEPPTNPPDPHWVWGFNPTQGWLPVYVPGPNDPQPH